MKNIIAIILFISSDILLAQYDITRLTELQKVFFVSETASIAATSYNPASMSMRENNNGVVLGYDFDEFSNQGNSSVFLSTNNFGFSYQDVYNINNVRLLNYAINLSIGNEFIAIGTSNRYIIANYPTYKLNLFSFDAGLILKPVGFLSLGLLARNLNEVIIDSLNYVRNYTAGIGITFMDETLNLYVDADFRDNAKIDDLTSTIGLVVAPLNTFEFRGGVVLNPEDILTLRQSELSTVELKYEAFLAVGFLIKNTIRVTASTRFNDKGESSRYSVIFGFPL